MFKSLYFKDEMQKAVDSCCDDRYEGTGVNDKTLGKMYYLKQFSKAADFLYDKLRAEIDHKDAVDKKVVASDKFFSVTASTRQGSNKIDHDKMVILLAGILQGYANEDGSPMYTDVSAKVAATEFVQRCTVIGKGSTVISVIENQSV